MSSALAVTAAPSLEELEAFVVMEAGLLDDYRLEAWLDLFAPDGRYWVPASWQQASPMDQVSLYYEDRDLLKVRIMRLRHGGTENMRPAPRTLHQVTNVRRLDPEPGWGDIRVASNLVMVDYRLEEQRLFAARCTHRLRPTSDGLRIVEKRVDLLNCDADAGFVRLTIPF